ncbi:MAG TPA: hypothetical protein VEI94_13845 [Candidatus Bathyarchaeia archaeon]|nr:hypothetical protein [Candidatus Bathyarchaeia archaeon]
MTFRDLLLLGGTLPLIVVIAERLAAEAALRAAPPPEALPAAVVVLGFALIAYVVLELRATAREVRRIAARLDASSPDVKQQAPPPPPARRASAPAQVSNFAIHLDRALAVDRSPEIDLRETVGEAEDPPGNGAARSGGRAEILGEVQNLLSRIPSVRQGGAPGAAPARQDTLDPRGPTEPRPPREPGEGSS